MLRIFSAVVFGITVRAFIWTVFVFVMFGKLILLPL
jgi:hypothetical protein